LKCKLSIQEKLKDLRIEKDLSPQELSEQTGISRASLGNYETDDYKELSHKPSQHLQIFMKLHQIIFWDLPKTENNI
jgi:transcriptional regulator with XRE-family HTH domain